MSDLSIISKQSHNTSLRQTSHKPLSRLDAMILINKRMREQSQAILGQVVQLSLNTFGQED